MFFVQLDACRGLSGAVKAQFFYFEMPLMIKSWQRFAEQTEGAAGCGARYAE